MLRFSFVAALFSQDMRSFVQHVKYLQISWCDVTPKKISLLQNKTLLIESLK